MNRLSNAHHFRKQVAGVCMMAAPALLLAGVIIHPETGTSESSMVAAAAGDPDAWYAAHLLILGSLVLAVPATLGFMHMLREREVAWGHVGGGLALLGIVAYVGIVTVEGFVGWQAAGGDTRGDDGAAAAPVRLRRLRDAVRRGLVRLRARHRLTVDGPLLARATQS